jgi:hypothetical protein
MWSDGNTVKKPDRTNFHLYGRHSIVPGGTRENSGTGAE